MLVINSTNDASNADDPEMFLMNTYPLSPFMFGVEIWHHDLNTGPRYFDMVLQNTYYGYGEPDPILSIVVPLEMCTKDHWAGYPAFQARYD